MSAIVIYESLTGNTRKAAEQIGEELILGGTPVSAVCPVVGIDYQALADADLVVVGTWVDGAVFIGQRPGGRIKRLPALSGKKVASFVTYGAAPGKTLSKLDTILTDRGAQPLGGYAISRWKLADGSKEFVDRLLGAIDAGLPAPSPADVSSAPAS
ncbi:MAG TPA: flavodoxin family protein [Acidimicrobiales bacterium]